MKTMKNDEILLIPNILVICNRLLVNSATNATPERLFSMARRINAWLKSDVGMFFCTIQKSFLFASIKAL